MTVISFRELARTSAVTGFTCVAAIIIAFAPAQPSFATEPVKTAAETEGGIRQPQYYLAPGLEDELNIRVQIWGEVRVPGLYIVADGTDLIEAISLAGGPTADASLSGVKVVRFAGDFRGVIDVDVSDYIESASEDATLWLQPNDTINVPARFWPKVGRWAGLLTTLALIANVVVNASNK
ncbi:MAG: SLBB domain-containing protein [Candidatus Eisenbacteria bacterium]